MSGEYAGEGSGREFQRVADELRFRINDGTYPLSSFLPSQRDLATEFRVSRDTIQRVLRELKSEGWIESRQGSGSRVVMRQRIRSARTSHRPGGVPDLGEFISDAFEKPEVTLDVATLTSESLDRHIGLQAERIARGRIAPQRIALRVLLPDEDVELPYGRTKSGAHDELLRKRFLDITHRHIASLRTKLNDLKAMKLVPDVEIDVRHLRLAPSFKVYLLNKTEALHGLYKVREREILLEKGPAVKAVDVFGLGEELTHHVKEEGDPDSPGSVFVRMMQDWFDSAWELLTTEFRVSE